MPDRSEWSVSEPQKITIPPPVERVRIRIVGGTVNVVGSDSVTAATLEVTAVQGDPLQVSVQDGTLTVTYADLPWQGFLKLLERKSWRRHAELTLAVPASSELRLGVVNASAVASGVSGRTEVRGVSGDTTLVGLSGEVRADTVAGDVDAQGVRGPLRFHSVSGCLTVVEGGGSVHADTVDGDVVLDLPEITGDARFQVSTVSGDVSARLPTRPDVVVEAGSASGRVSSAFEELPVAGEWAGGRAHGRLGQGGGKLHIRSVSGGVSLLRRPPAAAAEPAQHSTTRGKDL